MKAYKTNQGNWQLNFTIEGIQKTLYLGRDITATKADSLAKIVTGIYGIYKQEEEIPPDIVRKIDQLPKRIKDSLERFGLITGFSSVTIPVLFNKFKENRSHIKPSTMRQYISWSDSLIRFFGTEKPIMQLTKNDAESFMGYCTKRLSEVTCSSGLRRCRTIFKFAVQSGFIEKNPFDGFARGSDTNGERQYYVSRTIIEKVLVSCRDDRERLAVVLARFGGLRVPSELRELRFNDFSEAIIRIDKDTKTGFREVPLFREIREIFVRLTGKPDDLIFDREFFNRPCWRRLLNAVNHSGVERWPKLWINLRSSCITDLDELGYTEKTLDAIFGNSAAIRRKHYLQFRKEREYRQVLDDNARIVEYLRSQSGNVENDLSYRKILLTQKLLVTAFDTEKNNTLLTR